MKQERNFCNKLLILSDPKVTIGANAVEINQTLGRSIAGLYYIGCPILNEPDESQKLGPADENVSEKIYRA